MGNPVKTVDIISKLKFYFNLLEDKEDDDYIYRAREITMKLKDINEDLDKFLECNSKGDFSLTDEEKSFYTQRFLLMQLASRINIT